MTENEAIEELKTSRNLAKMCTQNSERKREIESYEMAIQALEEIQSYRAIGTVEQLEWCKDASHWKELYKEKLEQYEAIGNVEECRVAAERMKPKKPITYTDTNRADCPTCGATVRGIDKPFGN